jgi:hypothetical protein
MVDLVWLDSFLDNSMAICCILQLTHVVLLLMFQRFDLGMDPAVVLAIIREFLVEHVDPRTKLVDVEFSSVNYASYFA